MSYDRSVSCDAVHGHCSTDPCRISATPGYNSHSRRANPPTWSAVCLPTVVVTNLFSLKTTFNCQCENNGDTAS